MIKRSIGSLLSVELVVNMTAKARVHASSTVGVDQVTANERRCCCVANTVNRRVRPALEMRFWAESSRAEVGCVKLRCCSVVLACRRTQRP